MNTRKRKASVAFDDEFDYLYGIVITGKIFRPLYDFFPSFMCTNSYLSILASDCYFLIYTPKRIYCSKADHHIVLTEVIMDNDVELFRGVKMVIEVIMSLLKNRIEADNSPDIKRARPKNIKSVE